MSILQSSIQVRRDLDATWESLNPILDKGEPGYGTTKKLLKIGDGVTPWNNLVALGTSYSENPNIIQRPYPGGTLVDDQGANHASNTTIANADILWYLGTNGLTTAYTNPIDGTKIIQTNSGLYGLFGYSSPVVLADRLFGSSAEFAYCSSNVSQSWFRLNFGASTRISLTKIALQQGVASQYFKTLSVRYSSDGVNFTQAVSSTTINGRGDWHVFDVAGFEASQHLEISQTSNVDSIGFSDYFVAVELLLYGAISQI